MRRMMTLTLVGAWMIFAGLTWADEGVRPAKRDAVSVRWASSTPVSGYEAMTLDRDQKVYVARKAVLSGREIASAETLATRAGVDVLLKLTGTAADRFASQLAGHEGGLVALVSSDRLLAAGKVSFDGESSAMTLSGLSPSVAERVARVFGARPLGGPTLTVVPSQNTVAPGGVVTVDVLLSGVPDLRVYQVVLVVNGGTSGTLVREDVLVDAARPNYVFQNLQKLDAVDETLGRIGAVLFSDSVNAMQASYMGTYVLRASADASGEFTVQAASDTSTILWNSKNQGYEFSSIPTTITVK